MKIRTLRIENFRGLSQIQCEFDKPTNVIVGPNAIGKTTVLEAVRLTKALLMPRYFQEGHQVLGSLGAISQHPQLANYLNYRTLARDPDQPVLIQIALELSTAETNFIKSSRNAIAFEMLRGQLARNDEQSQLALTQYLSSDEGQSRFQTVTDDVDRRLENLQTPHTLSIKLTINGARGQIGGADNFSQVLVTVLERRFPPHLALFSYFPADRAFPSGEVNIQIGSGEATNQIQSHIGSAAAKYQRLKQTIVNNLLLSHLDQSKVREDFELVFERLLPGKELTGLSVSPVGTLDVAIKESVTGKIFDIDSMSSGEKGLILTFMLLRKSLAPGGIALLDEPELHLNPAVCKNIIPFLSEFVANNADLQILLCTHSAEILGAAFDHPECSIHHLRSHKDATKIYERDSREIFDALRRLGTTAAETLFSRGNIFVEGEHDAAVLEEGFYEQVMGYRITSLGGRMEVEKEIKTLQEGEKKGELEKLNCFIFDLDRAPANVESTDMVRVLQWDRYCLENYLVGRKLLFDELTESGVSDLGSRGTFEQRIVDLALGQLNEVVAREIYSNLEPDNPGLRSTDLVDKSYENIAEVLSGRLENIQNSLQMFDKVKWRRDFVQQCNQRHSELEEKWNEEWMKLCSGKRLIDSVYQEYTVRISKFDLKRRLSRRMRVEKSEEWTLIRSKILDALGV